MTPSVLDRLAVFFAQGCGLGWSRVGPGTVGSLGAVPPAWLLLRWTGPGPGYWSVVLIVTLFGVWASHVAIRVLKLKDPGGVVIDEIAAVLLIYTVVPWTWTTAGLGFVLFRIFDIAKPWPIRALERLPGAWGVMADDLAAGAIVAALLRTAMIFLPPG